MNAPRTILFSGLMLLSASVTSGSALPSDKPARSSLQYEGVIILPGLSDSVTVYRDERGMPHIYASGERDLYTVVGYISAQDRLWQMDLIRRSATGRLSEIFGKEFLQADIFTRCLRINEKSGLILQKQEPEILTCLQAYVDGVNAFINAPGRKLPVEFRLLSYRPEPWSLLDMVNIIGLMGWSLDSRNLTMELFLYQLAMKVGPEKASVLIPYWSGVENLVYPDFVLNDSLVSSIRSFVESYDRILGLGVTAFAGSNNWALSGSKTETGKPILSNDIHLTLGSPGIWMQMHHVIPGRLNVTGVMIPGEPFIIAGHNENVAWGMTNLRVDAVDLFAETVNPENARQYLFNNQWRDMETRMEVFKIKGGKQDTVYIRFTHRGPVITGLMNLDKVAPEMQWLGYDSFKGLKDAENISLSMQWTGYDESDEVRSIWLLNRAEGWDDFRSAMKTFRSISQNFVYADTGGNIGMSVGGGIPLRSGSGIMIRNGTTDEYDWEGYVPFEQQPWSLNPPAGHVSSANNRTVSDDYPYYISNSFDVPYRINRIREMLDEKPVLGINDLKAMVNDQHSDLARRLTPHILKLNASGVMLTPAEKHALAELAGWDYDMNSGLAAPSIFEFFRISFRRNIFGDEMGDLYGQLIDICSENYIYRLLTAGPDEWVDNISTEGEETLDDIVMQSYRECISALVGECGSDPENWKWGKIHTLTFMHPLGSVKMLRLFLKLNSDKYPVGGSDHTVSPYFSLRPGFEATCGASVRQIFNTADWDESYSVLPGGASGVPGSEFYLSQAGTYINGGFYKDSFSDPAVKVSAKYKLILKPAD